MVGTTEILTLFPGNPILPGSPSMPGSPLGPSGPCGPVFPGIPLLPGKPGGPILPGIPASATDSYPCMLHTVSCEDVVVLHLSLIHI